MSQRFFDYYRCPRRYSDFGVLEDEMAGEAGYFRFRNLICYGRSTAQGNGRRDLLPDIASQVRFDESKCLLPFNPDEVTDNLRLERYANGTSPSLLHKTIRNLYYTARPMLPVSVRRHLQAAWLKGRGEKHFPHWPVDITVDRVFRELMSLRIQSEGEIPFIWFWPEGKGSAVVMTHDVETRAGVEFMSELMDINDSYGIKSSFQIIPEERYSVTEATLSTVWERGFEVNVHDLKHDGHLFDDYEQFRSAAQLINGYAKQFRSKGFRAGVLYRNVEWFGEFRFSYDMSVPNNGHLDPQAGGCCTVMPYFIGDIVELPVTTIQDYSLFNILNEYSIDLWIQQIEKIMAENGLASFIVHPDYLNTEQARSTYCHLLEHLSELRANRGAWIALPGDVDQWWRQRQELQLVQESGKWRIRGEHSDRARLAYASIKDGKVRYRVE